MKNAAVLLGGICTALAAASVYGPREGNTLVAAQAAEHIGYTFSPEEAHIFAAGDMLFDRKIRQVSDMHGEDFIFSCIHPLISLSDFAVANLEGSITVHESRSVGSTVGTPNNFIFTFPTTTATLLARNNFRAVSIGNNHIANFGLSGIESTEEYLAAAHVGFFGGIQGNEPIFRTEEKGVPLSFVTYNQFGGASTETVSKLIAGERTEGRVVIVYAHWGEEYTDSSAQLRPIAEAFAQSGASVILGSHPHVVLGHERIGTTLVYYSLGNFIFDQYFSEDVQRGLTLMLHVGKEGLVTADEYPVTIGHDGRTCPLVQVRSI